MAFSLFFFFFLIKVSQLNQFIYYGISEFIRAENNKVWDTLLKVFYILLIHGTCLLIRNFNFNIY